MPSLAKKAFEAVGKIAKAGTREVRSPGPAARPAKFEWESSAQPLPQRQGYTQWKKYVLKDKAAVYRLPSGVETNPSLAVPGYRKVVKDGKAYLVRKDFLASYARQEGREVRRAD